MSWLARAPEPVKWLFVPVTLPMLLGLICAVLIVVALEPQNPSG